MVSEAEEFAEADKKVKARIDARNQLETYCYNMKQVGAGRLPACAGCWRAWKQRGWIRPLYSPPRPDPTAHRPPARPPALARSR